MDGGDFASETPVFVGTPAGAREHSRGAHGPCVVGVNFNPRFGLIGEIKNALGVGRHAGDDVVQSKAARVGGGEPQG